MHGGKKLEFVLTYKDKKMVNEDPFAIEDAFGVYVNEQI